MKIKYSDPQYVEGKLVLLSECPYEFKRDESTHRFFVVNLDNKIIYLDQFNTMARIFTDTDKNFLNFNFKKLLQNQ